MSDAPSGVPAALAARRACRNYLDTPLSGAVVQRLVDAFASGPTAGNTWAFDLVVLATAAERARYWDTTLPSGPRRDGFRWQGLLAAPLLIVVVVRPESYPERYAEADKAGTGRGDDLDAWPVPYWWVDGGAASMALLVAAADEGLGTLLFGPFDHEAAVRSAFGIPDDRRILGTIAVGHPAPDEPGRSARRARPAATGWTHGGRWGNEMFPSADTRG